MRSSKWAFTAGKWRETDLQSQHGAKTQERRNNSNTKLHVFSSPPTLTDTQVPECKHLFGITSSQLKLLNWHVSKTSGTFELNGQRGQTKTTEVAVSTTHETQFRNRIFLFPFLYSKERMWLYLMRREVESEGDTRLSNPLLKPNYTNSKCTSSGFRDNDVQLIKLLKTLMVNVLLRCQSRDAFVKWSVRSLITQGEIHHSMEECINFSSVEVSED